MSAVAFAPITINDGQTTPVGHTFDTLDHGNDNWTWRETGTTSLLGAGPVTLARLKVKGGQLEKWRIKVYMPALETATGQNSDGYTAGPKLAYSLTSVMDFIMPMRSTAQQRKDIRAYAYNLLNQVQFYTPVQEGVAPR